MHRPPKSVEALTNEALSKQAHSQFEIVGRAIAIADYLITSGKVPEEWDDNVAACVLALMTENGIEAVEATYSKEQL
jgi:hypothetical protein